MGDFIRLRLAKYAARQDDFPADSQTQHLDEILEFREQLKIEASSENIDKLNFAKIEHMTTLRQKRLILLDNQ